MTSSVMPVYTVDPDWIQKIFSLPFLTSFIGTLLCCYILSPLLLTRLVSAEKYKSLGKKTQAMNSYLSSAIHAIVACYLAVSLLASGDLSANRIFSTSPAALRSLHVTLGYTVGDTIVCLLDPHLRTDYTTIFHHVAMLAGISMALYHQLFIFFIVCRVLSEFSTPFVDLWNIIRELVGKDGKWYYAASIGMMGSFFLCRIVVIPWLNYELYASIFGPHGPIVPLHLRVYMVLNYGAFDGFNIYWFYKMLKGGYKLLCGRKRLKD